MNKSKSNHYVDNEKFLETIIRYKKECKEYREKNNTTDRLKNKDYEYIGACILKIAQKLSNTPNFNRYTWKDEMIEVGIMDCIKYMENFDETKYKNPFAYFTQLCWYASLRKIADEKKQKKLKGQLILNSGILENFDLTDRQQHDDGEYNQAYMQYLSQFIEEDKPKEKNKLRKTTRAYQKKMQELEEKEKQYVEQVLGVSAEPEQDDEDFSGEFEDLFEED